MFSEANNFDPSCKATPLLSREREREREREGEGGREREREREREICMFAACSGCLVFLGNDVNFTRDKRMPCDPYGRSYAQNCVNELSPLCLRAQLARQPERACKREREREGERERGGGRERMRERERGREGEILLCCCPVGHARVVHISIFLINRRSSGWHRIKFDICIKFDRCGSNTRGAYSSASLLPWLWYK